MAPERTGRLPVVAQAETALRDLGVRGATLDLRPVGRGHWFADWSGGLSDSDVYIALTGKSPTAHKVRLLLDDWIFDDVAVDDIGRVLTEIFSAEATIKRKRSYLFFPIQVLKVSARRGHYSAARKLPPDDELSSWERVLITEGDGGGN